MATTIREAPPQDLPSRLRHVGGTVLLASALLGTVGCGDRTSDATPAETGMDRAAVATSEHQEDHAHRDSGDHARAEALGILSSHTPDGTRVQLSIDPDPPVAGHLRLEIDFVGAAPDLTQITVDVVAPRMPAHGIMRFPTELDGQGTLISDIRIPMEGGWSVFVNLDAGASAAAFEFDVASGEDGLSHGEGHLPADHHRDHHDPDDHDEHHHRPESGSETAPVTELGGTHAFDPPPPRLGLPNGGAGPLHSILIEEEPR